jgi:tetratricopeptide (TPR) repeat protein
MDEILAQQPDAILIYAGHNEFYGALGVASTESLGHMRFFIKLYLRLHKLKTFLLMRNMIHYIRSLFGQGFDGETSRDSGATLMERLVAEQTIPYKSDIYELGKNQFIKNLRDIIDKAQKKGIPVVLSELVSNLRDQPPFISVETVDYPSADLVYRQAKLLEIKGDFPEARDKFYQAKDLDALRFRATEEFNEIIRRIATDQQIPVVSMKSLFESSSPNSLIGNELMLEHLHPNIDGYILMAEAFFQTLCNNGLISQTSENIIDKSLMDSGREWGYTALDSLYGDLRIRILKGGWPFVSKSAPNRALQDFRPTSLAGSLAVRVYTDDQLTLERAHVQMAENFEKRKNYDLAFREYLALICLTPFNVSPYLRAADLQIKQGNLKVALPILEKSLHMDDSFFANKWIGQILLNNNKVKESLPYLEKAHKMKTMDAQVLYNLSGAYAMSAQYEKASQVLDKLYKINPNFPDAEDLRRQLVKILKN